MRTRRPFLVWASFGVAACGLMLACALQPAPVPSTPLPDDAFAVVRATSEAAYASGTAHLDRGEVIQALVDLDTAATNDPDSRPEIQQALNQAIQRVQSLTPTVEPTPAPRTIGLPTLPAISSTPASAPATPPGATPSSAQTSAQPDATPSLAITPAPSANPQPGPDAQLGNLLVWRDPQGRFSIGAPTDWQALDQPQALFGTGVVEFRDPSGRIDFSVAVDDAARVVSPELYAAGMDIAMQHNLPGYAAEQALPGTTAGQPSLRRVFTFTQTDASGRSLRARGFQTTFLKGSTAYVISGSAPAEQFQHNAAGFDQMVETFRFS